MAQNEYLVDGADLTTVADAIREKGGTSEPLQFPEGMAAAVRGIQSNDLSLGITGATPGQIAKITAVDAQGKPTKWEPAEMAAGGGELTWHEVIDYETTEETNDLRISTDKSGRAISGYHALEMVLSIEIPADSTQASTSGTIWVYPVAGNLFPNSIRSSQSVNGWKTTKRAYNYFLLVVIVPCSSPAC